MFSPSQPARPVSIGTATACAILADATLRLDGLRASAERSLQEYARSRHDLEALIERLIAGLDAVDGDDEDREPGHDREGSDGMLPIGDMHLPDDWFMKPASMLARRPAYLDDDCEPSIGWTQKEAADVVPFQGAHVDREREHDGREPCDGDAAEETAPESYGRGFGPCAVAAARTERLFSTVAAGVLVKFKAGRLTQARAFSGEGRGA